MGMKSKVVFTSLLAAALISPVRADATCTIVSSSLQQGSEREIIAIIDAYCTKESGESGYYTEIAPDTYGEVMSVYGQRSLDNHGRGFESNYGFGISFSDSRDFYQAGVWIADSDGVVHSGIMTIANRFTTTTTSTTTIPLSPSAILAPVSRAETPTNVSFGVEEIAPITTTIVIETTTTTITASVESTSASVIVQIIKQTPKKKVVQKCSSRLKSCKLRAAGVTRTTGQK